MPGHTYFITDDPAWIGPAIRICLGAAVGAPVIVSPATVNLAGLDHHWVVPEPGMPPPTRWCVECGGLFAAGGGAAPAALVRPAAVGLEALLLHERCFAARRVK